MSREGSGNTWHEVLDRCVLQIAFRRVNNMHRQQIRRGKGRGTLARFKPHICSWWWSRSLWPCRRDTGSQLSSSWEGPSVPCKLSWKRVRVSITAGFTGLRQTERRLTRCASQRPGSRSLLSRWLFYLLSHGHWPQLHTHRRCSHQSPHRPNTGAAKQLVISQKGNQPKERWMVSSLF